MPPTLPFFYVHGEFGIILGALKWEEIDIFRKIFFHAGYVILSINNTTQKKKDFPPDKNSHLRVKIRWYIQNKNIFSLCHLAELNSLISEITTRETVYFHFLQFKHVIKNLLFWFPPLYIQWILHMLEWTFHSHGQFVREPCYALQSP